MDLNSHILDISQLLNLKHFMYVYIFYNCPQGFCCVFLI